MGPAPHSRPNERVRHRDPAPANVEQGAGQPRRGDAQDYVRRPRILSSLDERQMEYLRIAARMAYLSGSNQADNWLPDSFETGPIMDNDAAARMIFFHASHQLDMARYRAAGARRVEILSTDDSCSACTKLAEKKYKCRRLRCHQGRRLRFAHTSRLVHPLVGHRPGCAGHRTGPVLRGGRRCGDLGSRAQAGPCRPSKRIVTQMQFTRWCFRRRPRSRSGPVCETYPSRVQFRTVSPCHQAE